MIHYHGTPITPKSVFYELSGRNFCVSFSAPEQVSLAHEKGQLVMLDNGAFSFWTKGLKTDWKKYYQWCEPWFEYYTTWAVIPDVIDGTEEENDKLLERWPFPKEKSAPVYHLHESEKRLFHLLNNYPRICFGSSGKWATPGTPLWSMRISRIFDRITDDHGRIDNWIHMLRGGKFSGLSYPFTSVDSTNIARNHHIKKNAKQMAERIDSLQCPARWGFPHPAHPKAGLFY